MKTAKQLKKEARERFDERFSVFDGHQKIVKHVTYSSWVKDFIDQLIDTTIKQVLEGVKKLDNKYYAGYYCIEEEKLTKLAKEIEG
jgi:hypothetical protein